MADTESEDLGWPATRSQLQAAAKPSAAYPVGHRATPRGTRISTETRVLAVDPASRRRFALYWLVIRGGSGAIRRSWLHAIARRAERRYGYNARY